MRYRVLPWCHDQETAGEIIYILSRYDGPDLSLDLCSLQVEVIDHCLHSITVSDSDLAVNCNPIPYNLTSHI